MVVYLDANATEPLRPEARAAMLAALDTTGNPSSVHQPGRAARKLLEDARETLARQFDAREADVIFTSGGTEANALAIHAFGQGRRVIIGATEHDAVRAAARDAAIVPVNRDGVIELDALQTMLAANPASLVCLMLANNETGTLQPVAEAAQLARAYGAHLHVDAVQAAGRIPLSLTTVMAHSLVVSSHKLGGPIGAGALLLSPDCAPLSPLIAGGGQERGRRGGTPAVSIIVGFAAACVAANGGRKGLIANGAGGIVVEAHEGHVAAGVTAVRLRALRDRVEAAALAHGAVVCGAGAHRLTNTVCLALPGVRADAQVMSLDLDGVAVSAGAACSSGKVARSHVLAAMGLGALAGQAIRVSLPWNASAADIDVFKAAYARMAERLPPALATQAA